MLKIEKFPQYLKLIRFHQPIGTFLLAYPIIISFLWLGGIVSYFKEFLLFLCGVFLMRSAGCIVNDILDRKFDEAVKRTKDRPLAGGEVSIKEAITILFILLSLALLILLQFNKNVIVFGWALIIPILIYPLTKRFFHYPQIFLGAVFNAGIFMVWFALDYPINHEPFLFYFAFLFWTVGYDTVYAHQDKEDDIKLGLKSTAISFGAYNRHLVIISYMIFLMLLMSVGLLAGYRLFYFIAFNLLALYILSDLINLDFDERDECRQFFVDNNRIGLILVLIYGTVYVTDSLKLSSWW